MGTHPPAATAVPDPHTGTRTLRHPVRVLFVDHVARLSGGEISLARLVEATRGAVDAHVVLAEDGPLRGRLEAAGARVTVLPMADGLRNLRKDAVTTRVPPVRRLVELARYVLRLRAVLCTERPDVVHTNSLKAALYGGVAGRLAGVPVVWHVRDRIAPDYLPRSTVLLVRALALVLPSLVVANSRATLATLPGRRPRRAVLPNVVPPLDEVPRPRPRGDGPLRVGIVGRLCPWKGHEVYLAAFARAFARGEAEAVVVGDALFGEQEHADSLRASAEALGIGAEVDWRGFREDVPAELARLDVLVHASTVAEPFGLVVVEGMASGLPVVATAAGGPLEIVRNGVDGVLVPPGDAAALAAALRRLADDPGERGRLGRAGRTSSLRYSPGTARDRLLPLYDDLLRSRPPGHRGRSGGPAPRFRS